MVRSLIASLMLASVLGSALGCQSSSDSQPQPASGALSNQSATSASPALSTSQSTKPSISQADAIKQATPVVDAWLKLLDEGKYGESWDQTGKIFKDSSPKEPWCKQIAAMRNAFGPVISRTNKQVDYKNKIGEGPAGDYVTVHYDTAFKATDRGIEEVTAMREKDGTWRSLGYYVSMKPATPAARSTP